MAARVPPPFRILALLELFWSPQNEETRSQRFVESLQIPLTNFTFGDLGRIEDIIDLVNPSRTELGIAYRVGAVAPHGTPVTQWQALHIRACVLVC